MRRHKSVRTVIYFFQTAGQLNLVLDLDTGDLQVPPVVGRLQPFVVRFGLEGPQVDQGLIVLPQKVMLKCQINDLKINLNKTLMC